jgi:hypothetical protein
MKLQPDGQFTATGSKAIAKQDKTAISLIQTEASGTTFKDERLEKRFLHCRQR